ncbi:MAG: hypothetical protein AABZ00_03865 [Chloroflexota bacterium]
MSLVLFLLSPIALSLAVEKGTHTLAVTMTVVGFLAYGSIDYYLISRQGNISNQIEKLIYCWNWLGVIAPLAVYFWVIRGGGEFSPFLLWPLLIFPYYFLLRIIKPSAFYPRVLWGITLYSIIVSAITVLLAKESSITFVAVNAIWLLMVLIVISVHLRSWDYHNNRFEAYRELVTWAGSSNATFGDFQAKLNLLGKRLALERLIVLEIFRPRTDDGFRDLGEEKNSFSASIDPLSIRPPFYVKIVSQYNRNINSKEVYPWPLTRGLLAKSFELREPIKCMDTEKEPCNHVYFNPEGAEAYGGTRCEFVVPIFDAPDGKIVGFVDLQSDEPNSLQPEDLDYLIALASVLSPFMVKEKLSSLLNGLTDLRFSLEKTSDETNIFSLIAEFVQKYFDVDVVTYYPLGFGNGWPVLPPYQLGAWYPNKITNSIDDLENNIPISLVAQWKLLHEENARSNSLLSPSENTTVDTVENFVYREDIRSTVFIPIGTNSRRIGGLFLNYRIPQVYTPSYRLTIEMLQQTITPYLERGRQIDEAYKGFGRTAFVLHDLLNETLATSNLFEDRLDTLIRAITKGETTGMFEAYASLEKTVRQHTKSIASASLKSALDDLGKLYSGLDSAFRSAAGRLEERYLGRSFRWEFYPDSFDRYLPFDLRLAVVSIVVEAAHNAIRSGDANLVKVKLERRADGILIDIFSDGNPWDPFVPARKFSKYGIKTRLEIARNSMKATYSWKNNGRQLIVSLPLLPVIDGKDPYAN